MAIPKILLSWIGKSDIKARENPPRGKGPIYNLLIQPEVAFDKVYVITDYDVDLIVTPYGKWLLEELHSGNRNYSGDQFQFLHIKDSKVGFKGDRLDPTDYLSLYQIACNVLERYIYTDYKDQEADLTMHLSPGTGAMGTILLLLSQTLYPAKLYKSWLEDGTPKCEKVNLNFSLIRKIKRQFIKKDENILLPTLSPDCSDAMGAIITANSEFKAILEKVKKALNQKDIPILIQGETGTGKSLLAQVIHAMSNRYQHPFIAINCGAIQENLIESELFGHVKGAFTGAYQGREGAFQQADKGTLFLDEVGELPLSLQVKLLHAIQNKKIKRVGGTTEESVDIRILTATNKNLLTEVTNKTFREDLYYRISQIPITLPPLRERKEDIELLAQKFISKYNTEFQNNDSEYQEKALTEEAVKTLLKYNWPGNIRELENVIKRACLFSLEQKMTREFLQSMIYYNKEYPEESRDNPLDYTIEKHLENERKNQIIWAMKEANGKVIEASKILGYPNYQNLTYWLKKLGIKAK